MVYMKWDPSAIRSCPLRPFLIEFIDESVVYPSNFPKLEKVKSMGLKTCMLQDHLKQLRVDQQLQIWVYIIQNHALCTENKSKTRFHKICNILTLSISVRHMGQLLLSSPIILQKVNKFILIISLLLLLFLFTLFFSYSL